MSAGRASTVHASAGVGFTRVHEAAWVGGEEGEETMTDKFSNIKLEKRYKRISSGDVFTGEQLHNLLELANPVMQAIILLDVFETKEVATKPGEKYGV